MTLLRAWRSSTLFSLLLLVWANSQGIAQERSTHKQPPKLAEACDDAASQVRDIFQRMLFSVSGALDAPGVSEPCSSRSEKENELKRPDQPDEAERFYFLKRVPPGATQLPMQRYELARQQVRQMPRFSSRQARTLPSQAEAQRSNQALETAALETWLPLGPGNIGGRTRALLIHPTTPDTMWAAGVAGGVWKTTNGGGGWIPLDDMMANLAVNSMAMQPGNPDVIYAGTGEGYFNIDAVRGNGIFKTTDGGTTWTQLASTANNSNFQHVNDIVVSSNNSARVYAATRTGVWRSLDGGASWSQVHNPGLPLGCLDLVIRTDIGTNDTVFASCGGTVGPAAVFRNIDAGGTGTWDSVLSDGAAMGRTSLALAPSNQSTIYALASSLTADDFIFGLHKVFRSTTGGDTWTTQLDVATATGVNKLLLTNPVFGFGGCAFGTQILSQGWYDNVIAIDPLDPNRVWAGGIDLFRSDNGGVDWGQASHWWVSTSSARMAHADQHAIVFHPQYNGTSNKTMFVGNDGGVYRTTDARAATGNNPCDGTTGSVPWSNLNNGYAVTQFYHGLPFPDGTQYFGGTQDNGTILGADAIGPDSWLRIQGGDGGYVAVDPNNTDILYAEFTGASITKSTNGGATFTNATSGINPSGFLFIAPFTMDPNDSGTLWTGGAHIWRTINGATNWVQASSTIDGTAQNSVSSLAIAPTDSNRALVGTEQGHIHPKPPLSVRTQPQAGLPRCPEPDSSPGWPSIPAMPTSPTPRTLPSTAPATSDTCGSRSMAAKPGRTLTARD